jgi:hypothetical protein
MRLLTFPTFPSFPTVRLVAVAVLAAFVTAVAVGVALATNPKDLLLQSSDLPSGAKRVHFGTKVGVIKLPRKVHGKAAWVAYRFRSGRSIEVIVSAAGVVSSSSDAHAVFRNLKNKVSSRIYHLVRVPKYGDEQYAAAVSTKTTSVAFVIARSGTKLWELAVTSYPGFTKAKLVSELVKYAGKAKARAG